MIMNKHPKVKWEKVERNAELMKLRKKGYGYKRLASFFNLAVPTVKEIIKREIAGGRG